MKTDSTGWDRWALWGLVAAVSALGLSVWAWFPPGIWHDDGVYVLLGKALAQGEGLHYSGVAGGYPAPKFPPLYPLVLAGLWWLAPAFPENAMLFSSANLIFLAASAGVYFVLGRKVLNLPLPWVLAASALTWLSPALWRVAMVPLSESLFILCCLLALWAGGRMEQGGGRRAMGLFLVLAMAAFFARTIGVTLFLAASGALILRGRRWDGTLLLLAGGCLALPWFLWSRAASGAIPEPLLDTLGPYGSWLAGEIARDPGHYLSFLPLNAVHVLGRALSLLLPGVAGPLLWIGLFLVPVLLMGLWTLGRRSLMVPLSAGLYLLALLLWPFQDVRLMVPLLPLLGLGAGEGFRRLLSPGIFPAPVRVSGMIMGAGWVLVFCSMAGYRLWTGWPGEVYEVRSEALALAVRAVQDKTPPHAVVGAPELWAGLHLYTGRTVSPSARFQPLSTEGPTWGTPWDQYRLWQETGLTHILVEHAGDVHGEALDRVDARCPAGTVQLLNMEAGQFLVSLTWDKACQDALFDEEG